MSWWGFIFFIASGFGGANVLRAIRNEYKRAVPHLDWIEQVDSDLAQLAAFAQVVVSIIGVAGSIFGGNHYWVPWLMGAGAYGLGFIFAKGGPDVARWVKSLFAERKRRKESSIKAVHKHCQRQADDVCRGLPLGKDAYRSIISRALIVLEALHTKRAQMEARGEFDSKELIEKADALHPGVAIGNTQYVEELEAAMTAKRAGLKDLYALEEEIKLWFDILPDAVQVHLPEVLDHQVKFMATRLHEFGVDVDFGESHSFNPSYDPAGLMVPPVQPLPNPASAYTSDRAKVGN